MELPKIELSSIVDLEMKTICKESETPVFDEFKVRKLFENIIKEMELRWNLDERFKPPAWKQRRGVKMSGKDDNHKDDKSPSEGPSNADDELFEFKDLESWAKKNEKTVFGKVFA